MIKSSLVQPPVWVFTELILNKPFVKHFLVFSACLFYFFQQLIDLSSPLIKWSQEDKKENNAPLINLSS